MSKERELLERSIELIDQYWDDSKVGYPRDADNRKLFYEIQELLAQPEHIVDVTDRVEQEPVGYLYKQMECTGEWATIFKVDKPYITWHDIKDIVPVYTSPQKREPLGLEIMDVCGTEDYREGFKDGALYAEKCHGIGVGNE